MLNPFIWLLLLCIAMLVASFVAGCIPLASKLSESKLSFLTSLSVGLLISTSLVVIIPEGIETIYNHNEDQDYNRLSDHTVVGLSLLVGFAFMFIIDQITSSHLHPTTTTTTIATNTKNRKSLELDALLLPSTSESYSNKIEHDSSIVTDVNISQQEVHPSSSASTPTIGLMVHAAADGIALGASVSHPQLSMVVFFAIMLHKAPSSFALTTVLLNEGLSRARVRQHLLLFSICAPAGAISTYALVQFFSESFQSLDLEYWTGILLLFSGGTFLYVAMHAIQDLPAPQEKTSIDWRQLSSILFGMAIPFILNFTHSH
ncbi:Zinc/iron permease [Cokeromyces recurvatus]|uniref:Zinc/iron permease n=1 Tax=Cokeromyces recurvatus TaxID=90255 RepID=UPI002220F16C|nr:Zinc/iron permease [Cokeromyces recurvatus]KAI7905482.1 Zinc/iron permease [Cokeromyces recurvatus]